jgi:hypothetical protein
MAPARVKGKEAFGFLLRRIGKRTSAIGFPYQLLTDETWAVCRRG